MEKEKNIVIMVNYYLKESIQMEKEMLIIIYEMKNLKCILENLLLILK